MDVPPFYIVDTNVLSNPGDLRDKNVTEWLRLYGHRTCVSVVTAAEMRRGIMMLAEKVAIIADRKVAGRERGRLDRKSSWYNEVTSQFGSRFLPIDLPAAERWAEISVKYPSIKGGDRIIAATALARGYGVATENLGDFKAAGISQAALVNPFDPATWPHDGDCDPIQDLLKSKDVED